MNAKRVATHESSHALVGWFYGFNLSLVTISPTSGMSLNAAGLCKISTFDGRTEVITDPATLTAERFYMLCAGRQADEIYFPAEPNLSGADFAKIASMIPADDVVLDMYQFNWKKENLEAFYQRFKKPVEKLLRSRKARKAVKSLSSALLKAGTISGSEAVSILEKAWGKPLPTKARPAKDHCKLTGKSPNNYNDLLRSLATYNEVMLQDIKRLRLELKGPKRDRINHIWSHLQMGKVLLSD